MSTIVNGLNLSDANFGDLGPYASMDSESWKSRIRAELQRSGRSMRSVSLDAGLGEKYVEHVLRGGDHASVSMLSKVCDALGLSIAYVLTGVQLDQRQERLLQLWQDLPPEEQELQLRLLSTRLKDTEDK